MEKSLKVEIEDGGKVTDVFTVTRATVGQAARRFKLVSAVMEKDLSDHEKNQLLNCCALASVLKDEKGELLYPGDAGAYKIYEEMDYQVSSILIESYLELNPLQDNLKAKKKKS